MIKATKLTQAVHPGAGEAGPAAAPSQPQQPPRHRIIGDVLVVTGAALPEGGVPVMMYRHAIAAVGRVAADGALHFPLPACAFGGRLEFIDAVTGKALDIGPVLPPDLTMLAWAGWTCVGGRVSGRFRVQLPEGSDWTLPPVLPVDGLDGGDVLVRMFARGDGQGQYEFEGGLPRTLRLDETLTLLPAVAGEMLDQPLTLTPATVGILGNLDASSGKMAGGWAIDMNDRSHRVEVEIRINGARAGTTRAESYRDDLRELGLSDGHSGFQVPLQNRGSRGDLVVQAFVSGTEIELTGSPQAMPAVSPFAGSFDTMDGLMITGWVVDCDNPDRVIEVEAVCDGEVVGRGMADRFRPDVLAAGMSTGRCGFLFSMERPVHLLLDRDISVRCVGESEALEGSPRRIDKNNAVVRFMTRSDTIRPDILARLSRRLTYQTRTTLISIIMPIYNTRSDWLLEALNSVLKQWSANWELICVDDASSLPHVAAILSAAMRHDKRIKVIRSPDNVGIARATNMGLKAARGDYVTFLDHDDVIEPDAVHKLAMAAQSSGADLIYSDEVVTGTDVGSVLEVRARPSFSHDYYLSHPYFVHLVCVRRSLAESLGGWDESLDISGDVDFVLRVIETANAVAHVPSVLYRWRTHETSTGHSKKHLVTRTMLKILSGHLERLDLAGVAKEGTGYNQHRIEWPDDGGEVLLIIPTKNRADLLRTCIESIERTSAGANVRIVVIDHQSDEAATRQYLAEIAGRHTIMPYSGAFNYALMNNLAVKSHGGDAKYIIFCNNDVEAVQDGWVQRLRSLAGRPDVGAVGPLLMYGDQRVQHAGVLIAFCGAAEHVGKFQQAYTSPGERNPGYNCLLSSVRDYSAVTAACMIVRRDVLTAIGGFDERFVIGFNDTDLCLRIIDAGYRVLYDGQTVLFHHESATRSTGTELKHPEDDELLRTRWARYFRDGDPFYSPILNEKGVDHVVTHRTECAAKPMVRVVGRAAAIAGGFRKPLATARKRGRQEKVAP